MLQCTGWARDPNNFHTFKIASSVPKLRLLYLTKALIFRCDRLYSLSALTAPCTGPSLHCTVWRVT